MRLLHTDVWDIQAHLILCTYSLYFNRIFLAHSWTSLWSRRVSHWDEGQLELLLSHRVRREHPGSDHSHDSSCVWKMVLSTTVGQKYAVLFTAEKTQHIVLCCSYLRWGPPLFVDPWQCVGGLLETEFSWWGKYFNLCL